MENLSKRQQNTKTKILNILGKEVKNFHIHRSESTNLTYLVINSDFISSSSIKYIKNYRFFIANNWNEFTLTFYLA
jgi:hypothetical protein